MPKKISPDHPIFVAPGMLGEYRNDNPVVTDQVSGESLNPYSLDDKILIYERQVHGWFMEPAAILLKIIDEKAAFLVLSICLSYLEGVQQYMNGKPSFGKSPAFFCEAAQRVFSGEIGLTEEQLKSIYNHARCGMFHDGMTRSGVIYDTSITCPLQVINNGSMDIVIFNPGLCLDAVERDFSNYISHLRNQASSELRDNFDKMYSIT